MLNDLWHSARRLARTPGPSLALLLTIGLGVGGAASIDGFNRGLTTVDLPIRDLDTVVSIYALDEHGAGPLSFDDYLSLAASRAPFAQIGAVRESQRDVVLLDRALPLPVAELTAGAADLLGLSLEEAVAISDRLWRAEADARDMAGRAIRIDGVDRRLKVVASERLEGLYLGRPVDVWAPLDETSLTPVDRRTRQIWVLARLRPGVSTEQAQAAVNASRSASNRITVVPYRGTTPDMAEGLSRISTLLRAAAAALFFIACANVASFVLARASARSRDTAVCVALGAGRTHLARTILADSVLIASGGGALGIIVAAWTGDILSWLLFAEDATRLVFALDPARILVVAAACIAITIGCGLLPMFDLRDDDPSAVLRREAAGDSPRLRLLQNALLATQMACCCLLVVASGLLLSGSRRALETQDGRRLGGAVLLTAQAPVSSLRYASAAAGLSYFAQIERAARSVVRGSPAAWAGTLPGSRPQWQAIRVEPTRLPRREIVLNSEPLTAAALARVKTPPVAGRLFGGFATAGCRSVVVDQPAATLLYEENVVGRVVEDALGQRSEIIGVVAPVPSVRAAVRHPPTVFTEDGPAGMTGGPAGQTLFRVPVLPTPLAAALDTIVVSADYFRVMGMPIRAGRGFAGREAMSGCRVGVVNQEAAERYFSGDAVGGAIIDAGGRRTDIVGIVRSAPLRAAQRRVEPTLYLPLSHEDFLPRMTLILDPRVPLSSLEALRERVNAVPGGRLPVAVTTLAAHIAANALAPERIAVLLVGAAAAAALGLAIVGLSGSMADAARRQRRELAVRIGLGATGWRIARHVMAHGTRLAIAGTAAGMLLSLLVARWLAGITGGGDVRAPWAWTVALLLIATAVGLAGLAPVRRARATNPLTILRDGDRSI